MIGMHRSRLRPGPISGALLLLSVLAPALLAPWLPLADPGASALADRLLPTLSPGHPLGTDQLGRDLLSRLVWGARVSLLAGVSATLAAAVAGALLGLAVGLSGRVADMLLMRGIDILMAFPYLLLGLAVVAALGPSLSHVIWAVAIANVPFFARAIRDAVLILKEQDFVDAARLSGFGPGGILLRELLPNLLPVVFGLLATAVGRVVLEIAGLSFLGLGVQSPGVDLGTLLGEGRELLTIQNQLVLLPGLVLVQIVTGINLLGDGLRIRMDARRPVVPAVAAAAGESIDLEADDEPVEALLRVQDLRVVFPGDGDPVTVVAGVDLDLDAGERVGLVGESGVGKTMIALALMRLVPPPGSIRAGIRFAGQDIMTLPEQSLDVLRGNYIAYIPADPSAILDPLLTIGEQLREAMRPHQDLPKREVKWRVHALLEQVRLPKPDAVIELYPHQMSTGMRQQAAIAVALANGPELLIADEPTGELGLTMQEDILVLLDRLCREHDRALLFVSRNPGVAARLCRRVLVMYAGRIVEDGPVLDLVRRPYHPYSRELIASLPEMGRPNKTLAGIPDEIPDLVGSDMGCAFASRCRYVIDACMEREPDLVKFDDGRWVRCIRVTEIS